MIGPALRAGVWPCWKTKLACLKRPTSASPTIVRNNTDSAVFLFESANANADVEAGELTMLTLIGNPRIDVTDVQFQL